MRDLRNGGMTIALLPDGRGGRVQAVGGMPLQIINQHFPIQFLDDQSLVAGQRCQALSSIVHKRSPRFTSSSPFMNRLDISQTRRDITMSAACSDPQTRSRYV